MAKVLVTSVLAIDAKAALPGHSVVAPERGRLDPEGLRNGLATADALICLLTDRIDRTLLEAAPSLRIVANHAVGVDNVDVAACTERGILVANTPDVLTDATADLTWALLLAAARRLGDAEGVLRAGRWTGWEPTQFLGVELAGRTLGIVGLGRIGRAVARRAIGFGMRVIYAAPRPAKDDAATSDVLGTVPVRHVTLDELCAEADVVSLHCPATDATRGMFDAARLATLKPTAILVNTARGALIDEPALAAALVAGKLGAAALDVFVDEPRVHPALLAAPRTVLLPHIGSATETTRAKMGQLCVDAVRDALAGKRPAHLVNPSAWRGEARRALPDEGQKAP